MGFFGGGEVEGYEIVYNCVAGTRYDHCIHCV